MIACIIIVISAKKFKLNFEIYRNKINSGTMNLGIKIGDLMRLKFNI
jgi:hypothetical protein